MNNLLYLVKIEHEMGLVGDLEAVLPPAQTLRLVLLKLLEELQIKIYVKTTLGMFIRDSLFGDSYYA